MFVISFILSHSEMRSVVIREISLKTVTIHWTHGHINIGCSASAALEGKEASQASFLHQKY